MLGASDPRVTLGRGGAEALVVRSTIRGGRAGLALVLLAAAARALAGEEPSGGAEVGAVAQAGEAAGATPGEVAPGGAPAAGPHPSEEPVIVPLTAAERGAAAFTAARAAERGGRPEQEAAACRAVLAAGAPRRAVQGCTERLAWLDAHRDPDGGLAGLARLEALRRGGAGSLEGLATDPAVGAAVRAAAAAALAAQDLDRGEPQAALARTEAWWPAADLPAPTRTRVGRLRARALLALGRADEARAVEAALAPADAPTPPASEVELLVVEARRARLARWSGGVLGAWLLAALPLAAVGWRAARPRPWGLAPLLVVGGGGVALITAWAVELLHAALALLAVLALLHLLALGGALALRRHSAWARALFGLGSALATVAAAFLVLHRASLLPWIGL